MATQRVLTFGFVTCSSWLCASCAPEVEPEVLLGSKDIPVSTAYYHDFTGVSTHGELFDFQECNIDTSQLAQVIKTAGFQQFPDYSGYKRFYKKKLSGVASATWKRTPVDSAASEQAHSVFLYWNIQDDAHSRMVVQKNYLRKPGNYFAYYAAFPAGTLLYILVPAEGKLYIFRKRG